MLLLLSLQANNVDNVKRTAREVQSQRHAQQLPHEMETIATPTKSLTTTTTATKTTTTEAQKSQRQPQQQQQQMLGMSPLLAGVAVAAVAVIVGVAYIGLRESR